MRAILLPLFAAALLPAFTVMGPAWAQTTSPVISSGSTTTSSGSPTGSVGSGDNASPSSTQLRATEGSATINSSNVDAYSRSGNIGTSATNTLGIAGDASGQSYGSAQLAPEPTRMPRLPTPKVGIDLSAIRSGLEAAPSATPDAAGN
ncbi:hypothetical protein LQ948_18055 [Jiella sp. MQZ9-1]|uniref:Uncharacterized protein n=1 Tax=Jiella flava TaxID=2816857 RepID=A0A939JXD1_9HYPH|nr:hypothetical protein [Jiella flava]MBO0664474.1 hypothetical protein [Jiella flava]MCD2473110.1 hypothetical protein [Jiella flava]